MKKETYIKINMTENGDNVDLEFKGDMKDIVYLLCEAMNVVKKSMVDAGVDEEIAKAELLYTVKESLGNFE